MNNNEAQKQRSRPRELLLRGCAVVFGVLLLIIVESGLRIFNVTPYETLEDPFVGFHGIRPLFVLDKTNKSYHVAPSLLTFFLPQSFPSQKSPQAFRIFVLGGSTVQGRPYATDTSFSKWLEIALDAARPDRQWEVINCGGVSYASYRLVPIMQELIRYEPDLFILYTGHNEFLEDRTYNDLKVPQSQTMRLYAFVSRLRIFNLLENVYREISEKPRKNVHRPVLQTEVEALLDYRGGLELYQRNEQWQKDVFAHFASNIQSMAMIAQTAKTPMILMNPVSNLSGNPPFKSLPKNDITKADSLAIEQLRFKAKQEQDLSRAINYLKQVTALDDQQADYIFEFGTVCQKLGWFNKAKAAFIQAKDLDILPLRMLEPMHKTLFEISRSMDIPIVDARALIEERSQGGIPGNEWLLDHVHPTIAGHQLFAIFLVEELAKQGILVLDSSWPKERDKQFTKHLNSLDEQYYLVGKARLKGLRFWAEGRSTRVRGDHIRESAGIGSTNSFHDKSHNKANSADAKSRTAD